MDLNAALRSALEEGDMRTAGELLEAGANPNYTDEGLSLLCILILDGNVEGVKFLIRHGSDVNFKSRDWHDAVPLHFCKATNEAATIAKVLIENGADVNALTTKGYSPADLTRHDPEVLALIQEAGGQFHKYKPKFSGRDTLRSKEQGSEKPEGDQRSSRRRS